jgi:hypothetical protein
MERDFNYENNNIGYDYQYPEKDGGGIKCKNYILCEIVLPKWWFECKGCYLCINCHIMYGTWGTQVGKGILEITNNLECPVCLEIKECILHPICNHSVCIDCFKQCYYGDKMHDEEPIFPYPNIQDEYDDDQENIKWNNDYPLIKIYNEKFNKWYDNKI